MEESIDFDLGLRGRGEGEVGVFLLRTGVGSIVVVGSSLRSKGKDEG